MTHFTRISLAAVALAACTLTGCATEPPETQAEARALKSEAQAAMDKMYQRDPELRDLVDRSHGYAIFPSVGKGGLIAGAASGRGEVYEQGRFIGYATLNAASVGAQIGGQEFSELIVFQNEDALRRFRNNELSFEANASAVALKAGAAVATNFENGVAVFTLPQSGLMADASVGGQQFTFQPESNVELRPDDVNRRPNGSVDVDVDRNRTDVNRDGQTTETRTEIRTETTR